MNSRQKVIIVTGMLMLAISILIPPYRAVLRTNVFSLGEESFPSESLGYHFIFAPPGEYETKIGWNSVGGAAPYTVPEVGVDTMRLLVQIGIITLLSGVAIVITRENRRKDSDMGAGTTSTGGIS